MTTIYVVEKPYREPFIQWDGSNEDELAEFIGRDHTKSIINNGDGTATITTHTETPFDTDPQISFAAGAWVNDKGWVFTPEQMNEKYYTPEYLPAVPDAPASDAGSE